MDAELDGEKLTDDEILDICFLFMIAGLDTVTDSLDCMFAYLAQEPEHRRQLVEHPEIIPSAIEELLRWESPVPAVARVAPRATSRLAAARSMRASRSCSCSHRRTPTTGLTRESTRSIST